jgi:DNA repair exonuclease SbcCD nuclease subunit
MSKKIDQFIGAFTDIHIGLSQDSEIWHEIVLNFAKEVSEFYRSKKIKDIVIPGDIFHNRSEISVKTIHTAKKFFEFFKDFNVFISAGNHDSFFKENSEINSICLLDGWDNITIVDKVPLVIESKKGKKISLIPWGTKIEDIPASDICFGHFEISSFYMNSYKICEKGEESRNLLHKSPFIISGHFHKKDHRNYENGQILYMGSPYQQNFGDSGDERGFYIIDTEKCSYEFYENKKSPVFYKVNLKDIKTGKITVDYLKEKVPYNFVSLIIDEKIDSQELDVLSAKLQKILPLTFRIDHKDTSPDFILNTQTEYNSIDIVKNINDFIESIENINHKDEVAKYLIELYNNISK